MAARIEYYSELVDETEVDGTVLVVTGATVDEVADALEADRSGSIDLDRLARMDEPTHASYAFVEVPGGILAVEDSGYADPPNAALLALSAGGRSVAVVRENIQAHTRFGCARDGVLLFDADEYTFVADRSGVPAELRPLFDRAWVDLEVEDGDEGDDPLTVALAMAELVTGIELTAEQLEQAYSRDVTRHLVPVLRYAPEGERS